MNKTLLTIGAFVLASTSLSAGCPTCPYGSPGYHQQQRGYYNQGPRYQERGQGYYYEQQGRQYRHAQPQRYGQRKHLRQDSRYGQYEQQGQFDQYGQNGQYEQLNDQNLSESDREILMDIQATLRDNNFDLQSNEVTFFIENGVVTVEGVVISEEEKTALSDHISSVEGVEDVVMDDVVADDQALDSQRSDSQYQRQDNRRQMRNQNQQDSWWGNDEDQQGTRQNRRNNLNQQNSWWGNDQDQQSTRQNRRNNLNQRYSDRSHSEQRFSEQRSAGQYSDRAGMQQDRNAFADRDQRHGEELSDSELENRIRETLTGRWFAKSYPNVRISVNNGNVTLSGQVETESDRLDVENKTKEISGVKQIKNQLQIKRAMDTQSPESNRRL
jgi:osmotically-inducible protein OsmY